MSNDSVNLAEDLHDGLLDINLSDFKNLQANIEKTIEGYDHITIKQAFIYFTGGEFVKSKSCKDHEILNKFPHVLYNIGTKKIKIPKLKGNSFIINAEGTKVMQYVVAEDFLNYKKVKGTHGAEIKFKDGNKFNYNVDNLIVPELKTNNEKVRPLITEDEHGNLIEIFPEPAPKTSNDPLKFDLKWNDVRDTEIDIRDHSMIIRSLEDNAPYNLSTKDGQKKLIKDMRSVFACTNSTPMTYIFKDLFYDEESEKEYISISYTSKDSAASKLSLIEVGSFTKHTLKGPVEYKVNAWEIYLKNHHLFAFDYVRFSDDNPNTRAFTYFRGYKWTEVEEVDMKLIGPFLKHIEEVIADGNKDVYKYHLKWFASILQKPNRKMRTALVILGKQRTGKNVYTNVLCNLLLSYSRHSVTNLEHICGKFNSSLLGKKLIIGNELQSIDANKYINSDRMKSVITEKNIEIERKGKDVISGTNVANFIFCSNQMNPIKIETDDHKYCVTEVSAKYQNNKTYFAPLLKLSRDDNFYNHLFTYYRRNVDVTDFHDEDIPETKAKQIIQDNSKSAIELFFEARYHKIEDSTATELWDMYNEFCGTGEKVPRHIAGLKKNFDLHRLRFVDIPDKPIHSKKHNKTGRWINMKKDVLEDFEKKFAHKVEEEIREEKEKERKEEIDKLCDKDEEKFL